MEILVGTGGNQCMPIIDKGVSRIHCKIEVMDTGHIVVTNLSSAGTYLNGSKVVKRTLAKADDIIRLGESFSVTIGDLIQPEDYSSYTCHQVVMRKYKDSSALQVFIDMSSKRSKSEMPSYVVPVAKSSMACYMIGNGRYGDAQNLIYDAGDTIYDMQDGSALLQGIYASMLCVCARLYQSVGRIDLAQDLVRSAVRIFSQFPVGAPGCSQEQIDEAKQLKIALG